MESEKILVAAGLTAAAVVGAFVFWGPATTSGNRGRLAGLVNLGKTCFLNAVLHALAACPQFIEWLEKDRFVKETSLRGTLATVLSVVNGTNKSVKETYAPAAVINALKRLGWVIPAGEQDAHELLNVLLTTLDEETHKIGRKAGCLSDALGMNELEEAEPEDDTSEFNTLGSVMSLNELCRPSSLNWRGTAIRRNRWISRSCRALQMSGPPQQPVSHPFTGTLTSQLRCTECGHKSSVRYDKFESLSLALPSGAGDLGWGRHKLHQLLTNFVTPEVVPDVQCEGCNSGRDPAMPPVLSKQIKILNFGKTEQFTLLWILFVVIVAGNLGVLYTLLFGRSRKSRMNYFITHLALADLSVGLINVLTDIVWKTTVAWYAGNIACKGIRFLQVVVTYASTYVLVALSIDRYDAIRHPMKFSGSWKRAKCLIITAWFLSSIFSFPILILYEERVVKKQVQCWIDFDLQWKWQLYMTLVSTSLFIIPAGIIAFCYTVIIVTIWSKNAKGFIKNTRAANGSDNSRRASSRGLIPRAKVKTIKITFVIVSET